MNKFKTVPEEISVDRLQSRLVLELAIIFVSAFVVFELEHIYDWMGTLANWVLQFAPPLFVDEIITTSIFLGLAAGVFSFRRWRDVQAETLERRKVEAALRLGHSELETRVQERTADLALAYDATIEGWSHALDLRDKETEGHTQRVTKMTVNLMKVFGLSEAELVQVRWGALLHDIGKMGVPDGILLKPGSLTEDEWVAMKKHPTFAYELLSPIRYLQNALDIPYCHHEKWDGTGYPRGLKGEQIPLPARIFSVVDVWDALTSDRPYRLAWTEEKTVKHIQSLSGTDFDPQVVKIILESGELVGHEH